MNGWKLQDRPGSHRRSIEPVNGELSVQHEEVSLALCTAQYYWSAPEEYLGMYLDSAKKRFMVKRVIECFFTYDY